MVGGKQQDPKTSLRKSRQAVGAVLEEIAPHHSDHLWKMLVSYKSREVQGSSSDTENGDVLSGPFGSIGGRNLLVPKISECATLSLQVVCEIYLTTMVQCVHIIARIKIVSQSH